jgi:hypothetical protein
MMNSDLVLKASDRLAEKLLSQSSDPNEQTSLAYRSILGRMPSDSERTAIMQFLVSARAADSNAADSNTTELTATELKNHAPNEPLVWSLICQSLLSSNEFFYLR